VVALEDALSPLRPLALMVNSRQQDNVEAYPSDSKGRVVCRPCLSPVADFITRHDTARFMVRWSLLPLVGVSWMALYLGPGVTLTLLILLLMVIGGNVAVCLRRWVKHRHQA
jgi:hypothetical protein